MSLFNFIYYKFIYFYGKCAKQQMVDIEVLQKFV